MLANCQAVRLNALAPYGHGRVGMGSKKALGSQRAFQKAQVSKKSALMSTRRSTSVVRAMNQPPPGPQQAPPPPPPQQAAPPSPEAPPAPAAPADPAAAPAAAPADPSAAAAAPVPAEPAPPPPLKQEPYPGLFGQPTVGAATPLGASLTTDGVNFAVYTAAEARSCNLCIFTPEDLAAGKDPTVEIPLDPTTNRTGNVWHIALPNASDQMLYGYRVDGPNERHLGHHFNPQMVLLDPYARGVLSGDRKVYGELSKTAKEGNECWPQYAGAVPSRNDVFDWEGVESPKHKMQDICVYETHVRGFTADAGGTYADLIDRLPYLKRMGFNCLELMPCHEFNELEYYTPIPGTDPPEMRYNYWGYSTVNFFSPKQLFARSAGEDCGRAAAREFKTMVRECHRNGIEVIMDVVFNHTAEGNEKGLTLSFRGLDNRTYYMVAANGEFYNYSGCGNTLNCNHPVVRQMIVDSLRYWVTEFHIDGFRFDLASIMTRASAEWDTQNMYGQPTPGSPNMDGVEIGEAVGEPPVIAMISNDPILGKVKLIAEAWDAGGLYQVGSFPHFGKWAEWNGRFRDDVRNFIRGFDGYSGLFAECMCGSPTLYMQSGRKPEHSINFITAHDGFTLRDLVSYNEKHNHANGENNNDGEENNQSWNCGLGPHEDGENATPIAKMLRDRQMRNFFTALFVAQGTPMVYMGDEYGHTKGGNNNTYCHDTELNYMDWGLAKDPVKNQGLSRFCRLMRQFRAKQPALRMSGFPNENNIQWHGHSPNEPSWDEENRFVAFTVKSHEPGAENSPQIYCAFNSYHLPAKVVLPDPPHGHTWKLVSDTALQPPYDFLDADDIPAQSKAAAEAMIKPSLSANCYTVMDRASIIVRAEPLPYVPPTPEELAAQAAAEAEAKAAAEAAAAAAPPAEVQDPPPQ